jgi:WXXGXW repeat (2 copies)
MKKYFSKIIMILVIAISFAIAAEAQFVVNIRPAFPVQRVRPACPSPGHVWIGGNYLWHNNRYNYNNGYWAAPPRYGYRRVDGHWKNNRRGWYWVPGHWRR